MLKLAIAATLRKVGDLVDGTGQQVAEAGTKIEGTVSPVALLRNELALAKLPSKPSTTRSVRSRASSWSKEISSPTISDS
jgi:hypothetical protein